MQRPLAASLLTALALTMTLSLTACAGAAATAPKDTRAPTVPSGVTATAGSASTVHVMWSAATDDRAVTGYAVYREGGKVKDLPATTLMTDVVGLAPATPHRFTVRARDAAGNVSPPSVTVTATTLRAAAEDRRPPTTPTALRVTADGSRAATLRWSPARDDTRVTAYDVYQADTRIHTVPGTTTTAHLTGLRPGTAYAFTVRARDAAENSSPDSAPADLTTAPSPGAPPNTAPRAPHRHGPQGRDHPHLDTAEDGRPRHPPRTPPRRPVRHHHRLGHHPAPRPRDVHLPGPGPAGHPLHGHPAGSAPGRHLG
ncbi:hypothetical protein STANM309S_03908 [Streptomyces tanashiensis]